MNESHSQTLALAGLVQAASLTQQGAHTGFMHGDRLEPLINSLFVMSPSDTASVYGSVVKLKSGLSTLLELLDKGLSNDPATGETLRYILSILHLESQLKGKPAVLDAIGHGLEQIATDFPLAEERTEMDCLLKVAALYQTTAGTMKKRIQVRGDYQYLSKDEMAAKVRVTLLSGLRSAVLWRQVGGKKWHLLLHRQRIKESARELLKDLNY